MKIKIRNVLVFLFCLALFFSAVPVFSWGDSTPDSDTEGFSDDPDAMEDYNFYTGNYDPEDFDENTDMNSLIENYYSALSAYAQAVQDNSKASIIDALEAKVHEAQEAIIMYADCHQDKYTVSYDYVENRGGGVSVKDNSSGDIIMKAGDPVMLCSGVFVLDEEDLVVKSAGVSFSLNRYFSSEEWDGSWKNGGVFGNKWASIIDSRIIRGSFLEWEKYLSGLKNDLVYKKSILEEMVEDNSAETYEVLPDMRKFYKTEYEEYLRAYDNCIKAVENKKLSENACFGFSGNLAFQAGTDCLVYVDEKGTPLIFEKSAGYENLYECNYEKLKQKLKIQVGEELIESTVEEFSEGIELIDEELLALEIPFCESEEEILEKLDEKKRTEDVFYLIDQKGNRTVFNDEGFIQEIQYSNGSVITFIRDDAGRAVCVQVNGGRSIEFDYQDLKLVKVTDGCLSVEYDYDDRGMLVSIIDKDGDEEKFVYDEALNLLRVVKADSNYTSFEYKSFEDGKLRTVATTNENGFKESFDYDIRKMKTVYSDYDGVKTQVFYDECGRTLREIHSDGLEKSYIWNDLSDLEQVEFGGEITRYRYDDERNLTEVLYSDGTFEKWTYTNGRIKTHTDKKGVIYSYGYDISGNCIALYRNGWLIKKSSFNKNGSIRSIQDEYGATEEFTYDGKGNLKTLRKIDRTNEILNLLEFEYDLSGRPVKVSENNGRVTNLVYGNHFVKSRCNDGYETEVYYSSRKDTVKHVERDTVNDVSVVHEYKWDNCHNLLEAYTNGILVESNVYSAGGRVVKRTVPYDESRNIVYEYVWKNGDVVNLKKYFSDKSGNITGKVSNTDFSAGWKNGGRFSSVLKDGNNISYDDIEKLKADFFEMSDTGLLRSYTDRSGIRFAYEYDGNGNASLISSIKGRNLSIYKNGILSEKITTNRNGKILQEEKWKYLNSEKNIKHSSGDKYFWAEAYDVWGNVISFTDGEDNTWKMKYDCFNNCISRTDPYGNKTKFDYNMDGTLRRLIEPDGSVTSYEYDIDSNCISVRDENGYVFRGEYDGQGRLICKEELPFSGKSYYEYDDNGRIVKVRKENRIVLENNYEEDGKIVSVDATGNKTLNATDGYFRTISITNRLGAVKEFKYNSDGTTSFCSDFNKEVSNYSYSDDGLVLTVKYSDGSYVIEQRDYLNRIIRVENETGWEMFEYDTGGKLIKQYDSFTGAEVVFSYDKRGLLIKTEGNGRNISYVYGKAGELKKVIENDDFGGVKNHLEVSFEYDSNGRKIEQVYSSGEKQKFYYDKGSRLILTVGYDSDGKIVMVEGNVYDKNGFRTLVLNSDYTVTRYKYDEDGKLCQVQYPYSQGIAEYLEQLCLDAGIHNIGKNMPVKRSMISSEEYSSLNKLCSLIGYGRYQVITNFNVLEEFYKYDPNGNMITRKTPYGIIEYGYDKENRLIRWGNGCKAEYDSNGNMISRTDVVSEGKFKYSKRNRVVEAHVLNKLTEQVSDVVYGYDALGRRNYESSVNGAFKTVYRGLSFEEFKTIQCGERLHPVPLKDYETGYRYSNDDYKSGNVMEDYSSLNYAALYADSTSPVALINFGSMSGNEPLFTNLTGTIGSCQNFDAFGAPLTDSCQFGFAGKKYDCETKMYNFGFRDYDVSTGRFISEDPVYDGMNWYTYCNGDPVNFVDPLGLELQGLTDREMQTFGNTLLGKSNTETIENFGCLITAFSEIITQFTGTNFLATDINDIKGMFNSGDLNYNAIAAVFGLSIEQVFGPTWIYSEKHYVEKSLIEKVDSIKEYFSVMGRAVLAYTGDITAAFWYDQITNYEKNEDVYALIAQVIYNSESKAHFVNVVSNVTLINDKAYIQIAGTSKFDADKNLGNNRKSVGWIIQDGKVYVPTRNIVKIVACEKR